MQNPMPDIQPQFIIVHFSQRRQFMGLLQIKKTQITNIYVRWNMGVHETDCIGIVEAGLIWNHS